MFGEKQPLSDPRDAPTIEQQAETIRQQAETIRQQADRLSELEEQVKALKALLDGKAESKASKKPDFKDNYSLDRNGKTKK